jgi:hypothetical protein
VVGVFCIGVFAPQCHLHYLAVGLPLGRYQGISVHVHRGGNLSVPHEFLLHAIGAPVLSSQERNVCGRYATLRCRVSGNLPPLVVQRQALSVPCLSILKAPDSHPSAALQASHKAAASGTNVVLLRWNGMEVTSGCGTREARSVSTTLRQDASKFSIDFSLLRWSELVG